MHMIPVRSYHVKSARNGRGGAILHLEGAAKEFFLIKGIINYKLTEKIDGMDVEVKSHIHPPIDLANIVNIYYQGQRYYPIKNAQRK